MYHCLLQLYYFAVLVVVLLVVVVEGTLIAFVAVVAPLLVV